MAETITRAVPAAAPAAGGASRPVSAFAGVRRVPPPVNEPVKSYAPGSPEKSELKARLSAMAGERPDIEEHLEALRPDLIVMFDTDHLNTFFLDNLPIFAVGVCERFKGPATTTRIGATSRPASTIRRIAG